jgi:chromosome segregation ATPase
MKLWPRKGQDAQPLQREAIGNFSLTAQLAGSSGRSMQVAGYIYSDDDETELNARLDMYQRVVERQRIRSEIPELEAKREQMLNGINQAREVLSQLEDRRNKGDQLSSNERMQITNMSQSIKKMLEEVDKGTEAIEEAKKKAGVGA